MVPAADEADAGPTRLSFSREYHLHGLHVRSEWPLPYASCTCERLADITLREDANADFAQRLDEAQHEASVAEWFNVQELSDGTLYLRWKDLFEFLVSPTGSDILGRPLASGSPEAFHAYLLGQVLSFALIRQKFEPLHATTVVVNGKAVAILGLCGYGKSTLAASLLRAGCTLLTDDLLVLTRHDDGGFIAHPGPPRIKLSPESARGLLGPETSGVPLVPGLSPKWVVPLDQRHCSAGPAPLQAIYLLAPPNGHHTRRIGMRRLRSRRAFVKLLRHTFNTVVVDTERLERQFSFASSVASSVPVNVLSYPRSLDQLPGVRDAVLGDLGRMTGPAC